LIAAAVVSLVAVAILPVHEASAKECNSNNNNDNNNNDDENNNSNDDTTTCTNQQGSKDHDHSASSTQDSTPFVLSLPFP
jgi:ABC-type Zn2+ transport system substrate-binding protein/surface adhesin